MLDLIIIGLCLALNAFFSAYEMAFVTVRKEDLEELDNEQIKKRVLVFKKKTERTLSAIQIGITMVGAIAAAVGGTGAVETLEPYMVQELGFDPRLAQALAVVAVILPLTYLSVVIGELVPKSIALKRPLLVISLGTTILHFFDRFLSPVVSFLEKSTAYLLRKFKLVSREQPELSLIVDIGALAPYHRKFVENLVGLRGRKVERAFIPLAEVSCLDFSDPEEVVREKILKSIHTRLPVLDGKTAVGYLHARVYLQAKSMSDAPWDTLIQPMIQVKREEKILEVFLKLQRKKQHLSAVIDDEENVVGIMSLEDVIEEIVGDIEEDVSAIKLMRLFTSRNHLRPYRPKDQT